MSDMLDVANAIECRIVRLETENARLRHTLATVRDDLSGVSSTGEELHEIASRIQEELDRKE